MPTPTAILVIDVQIGMFDGLSIPPVYRGEELLATITALLGQARAREVPVVFVQHMGGAAHPLAPNKPGYALHPALDPQPDELIVQKTTPDSFHQTGLRERLDALGVRTLVVVGIQTDLCVDTTTRRAASLGYDVRLISDGHSTWPSGELSAAQIIAHHNLALDGWFATPVASGDLNFDQLAAPPHVGRAAFCDPSVNYYVADVEASARFYTQRLGFTESFRTPAEGTPVHVEVRLGDLVLGLAARSAGEAMHGLPLGQGGPPRAEVVVWADNVDAAYAALVADGVPGVSAPHDFLGALRAAWVLDPDGNPVEIVTRIAAPQARV